MEFEDKGLMEGSEGWRTENKELGFGLGLTGKLRGGIFKIVSLEE